MSPAEQAMERLGAAIKRNGELVQELLETIAECRERASKLPPHPVQK